MPSKIEKQADDTLRDLSPLCSGYYRARINGRDICTIRMTSPWNDDWSGDMVNSKGCKQPEKFKLTIK